MPEEKYSKAALIVGFARSGGIIRTLHKLIEGGIEKIYVAIDGAKYDKPNDVTQIVLKEIEKIRTSKKIEIKLWAREENLGLAVSMITAIDWFFQFEKIGIILEDDLEFSEDLIDYFNSNSHFLNDSRILMLSGNNFSPELTNKDALITYPLIWGWCTDKNSWKVMKGLIFSPRTLANMNCKFYVKSFWFAGSLKARFGNLDSWALPLAAGFYSNNYYCLIPKNNLVRNLGDDEHATHTLHFNSNSKLEISRYESNGNQVAIPYWDSALDAYLEHYIYRISRRNLLSPITALVQVLFLKSRKSLKKRVSLVTLPTEAI